MKKYFIILVVLAVGGFANRVFAQQTAQWSQYMFNTLYYNPAFAGIEGATKFSLFTRDQWTGYSGTNDAGGAPKTHFLSANTPILMLKSGAGFHLMYDQLGAQENIEAQVSYAYHLPILKGKLSIGVRAGIFSSGVDFDKYRFNNPEDPLNKGGKESQIRPDMALGVYYRAEKYYFGASFGHLIKSEFDFGVPSLRNALDQIAYFTVGYDWEYSGDLTVTPSVLVQSDFKQLSVQIGGVATFKNKYWGGLSFRQSEAAIVMLGMSLFKDNSLKVGYAFDYVIKAKEAKSPTSHEIMLSYTLPQVSTNKKSIIRTPRFRQ